MRLVAALPASLDDTLMRSVLMSVVAVVEVALLRLRVLGTLA
jgi:hypothetical protein